MHLTGALSNPCWKVQRLLVLIDSRRQGDQADTGHKGRGAAYGGRANADDDLSTCSISVVPPFRAVVCKPLHGALNTQQGTVCGSPRDLTGSQVLLTSGLPRAGY